MTERDHLLMERIRLVRARNLAVYAEMARLTTVDVGWVRRDAAAPDATLALIRQALQDDPEMARFLLHKVAANDAEVVRLTEDIANG